MRRLVKLVASLSIALTAAGCGSTDEPAARISMIKVDAMTSDRRCPDPAKPILLKVTNGADVALDRITFVVELKQRGHSDVLYRTAYTDDTIVLPSGEHGICIERLAGLKRDASAGSSVEEMMAATRLSAIPDAELDYVVRFADPIFDDPGSTN